MQFFHCYLVGPLNLQHGKIFITSYSVQNWPTKMVTSNEKKKKSEWALFSHMASTYANLLEQKEVFT